MHLQQVKEGNQKCPLITDMLCMLHVNTFMNIARFITYSFTN